MKTCYTLKMLCMCSLTFMLNGFHWLKYDSVASAILIVTYDPELYTLTFVCSPPPIFNTSKLYTLNMDIMSLHIVSLL